MLAQTSDWQRWENRPRAWRGAAEPSPRTLQGHQPVHGQVGREVFTAPWGYVGWGDHGPLGQAQLQQAVTKKLPPRPPCPGPGSCRGGEGISLGSLGPRVQPQTLCWKWGQQLCCVHVKQGRGADAKWDEAASHPSLTAVQGQCRETQEHARAALDQLTVCPEGKGWQEAGHLPSHQAKAETHRHLTRVTLRHADLQQSLAAAALTIHHIPNLPAV